MSLFEVEINKNFKISNIEVFLSKKELEKYYKLNNLNNGYSDDISVYLLDDLSLNVHHDSFLLYNYGFSDGYILRYDIKEITNIVKSNLYLLNKDSNEEVLYPEWLLFFIAIVKKKVKFISENSFRKYLKFWKHIAEVRYKSYIIRGISNYINIADIKNSDSYKDPLYNDLKQYAKNSNFETSELFDYLNFLYAFYNELKENESYKLMWNLEEYIIGTVNLLIDNDVSTPYHTNQSNL